jgi:hypothetical protein
VRALKKLPRGPKIPLFKRDQKDAYLSKRVRSCALLFLVLYGLLVYQGLVSSPVPEIISSMHDKFVDITEFLKSGAEVESHLLSIEKAMEHAEELSKCTTETCADENRSNLSPFLAYLTEEAKRAYEEDLAANATGTESTHDLYLGLFHLQRHIKTYTPSEHSANVNKIVQGVVFSLVHKYIPEEVLKEMGPDFNVTNFRAMKDAIRQARILAHNATLAEEKFRALWNDMEHLSLALGINKWVDSWRHDLENWGLSTDSSLILIGIFGPDLPGQMTFTNCIVRHYVDSAFAPQKLVSPDGTVISGPLKWNGLTVFQFAIQVLFGRGLCYLFYELKVIALSCLMGYFSFGYGVSAKILNAICHEYEAAKGGFDSWDFLFFRSIYLFIRSFRFVSFWIATLFLITTTSGIVVSFVLDFGYSLPLYLFFGYFCLKCVEGIGAFVAIVFTGESSKMAEFLAPYKKTVLFAGIFCLSANAAGTLALHSLGEIALEKYSIVPTFEYISEKVFEFGQDHVRPHFWTLLFQFAFFFLCLWIASSRKYYKDLEFEHPDYEHSRNGRNPRPEWEMIKKEGRFWRIASWILYAVGWSQPILAVLLKNVAPLLGITFFKNIPHLGHLSFDDGGINYLWSLLDMATLPISQFKLKY